MITFEQLAMQLGSVPVKFQPKPKVDTLLVTRVDYADRKRKVLKAIKNGAVYAQTIASAINVNYSSTKLVLAELAKEGLVGRKKEHMPNNSTAFRYWVIQEGDKV